MIDKTKSYRFKGDSERWTYHMEYHALVNEVSSHAIAFVLAERFSDRGILLEYPELPGEDWEFCESDEQEMYLTSENTWVNARLGGDKKEGLYCRKKKAPTASGKIPIGGSLLFVYNEVYWTTDPEKGKELLK